MTLMAAGGLYPEFWRFCLVGGSGVLVNLAVFQGALMLWAPILPASALAFVVAASSNFVLNRAWTFRGSASREGTAVRWAKFLGASLAGLAANLAVLALLTSWLGAWYILAQLAGIGAGTLLNFQLSRLWVFRARGTAPAPS
jgi:putative flippase GtrA